MSEKVTPIKPYSKTTLIACPQCKKPTAYNQSNPARPFCSKRCKDADFIGWSNEEKVIHGNSLYDDLLSGDLQSPEGY